MYPTMLFGALTVLSALALALQKYRWQQYEMTLFASIALVGICLGFWRIHQKFADHVEVMCANQMLGFSNFNMLLPQVLQAVHPQLIVDYRP